MDNNFCRLFVHVVEPSIVLTLLIDELLKNKLLNNKKDYLTTKANRFTTWLLQKIFEVRMVTTSPNLKT
jgi:hypothetical protein